MFANGFTITIVDDWEVDLISTQADATSGAIASGRFSPSGYITITADLYAGASTCLYANEMGAVSFEVVGSAYGGDGSYCYGIDIRGGTTMGTISVGSVYGGGGSSNAYGMYIQNCSPTVYVEYAEGSATNTAPGINQYITSASSIPIVYLGSAIGSSTTSANGLEYGGGYLYVDYVEGRTGGGIRFGSVTYVQSFEVDRVTCTVPTAGNNGIWFNGSIDHADKWVKVRQVEISSNCDKWPINCEFRFLAGAECAVVWADSADVPISLVDAASLSTSWFPAAADVRAGVAYANGGMIGTCQVPNPSNVSINVGVDDTVGTAVITPADVLGVVGQAFAAFSQG